MDQGLLWVYPVWCGEAGGRLGVNEPLPPPAWNVGHGAGVGAVHPRFKLRQALVSKAQLLVVQRVGAAASAAARHRGRGERGFSLP